MYFVTSVLFLSVGTVDNYSFDFGNGLRDIGSDASGHVDIFHQVQAPLVTLVFRDERLRTAEPARQLLLRQPRGPAGLDKKADREPVFVGEERGQQGCQQVS